MQRPVHKDPACGAKLRREIRPLNGMPTSAALAGLGLLWAISGCFNPTYGNCRITCTADKDCPSSLACVLKDGTNEGLCAPRGMACFDNTDAGADADAVDTGVAATDAMDTGTDGTDSEPDGGPPEVLCRDADHCLPLPEAVRANIVLLLWPSNLPPVGSTVEVWRDQSGQHNDAYPIYPSALPHVIASGVKLDSNQAGSGFEVADSASLDFASGDFAVIVVAGLAGSNRDVAFFNKNDGAPGSTRKVSLRFSLSSVTTGGPRGYVNDLVLTSPRNTSQPSVGVYNLRRRGDHVDLRLNGGVVIGADFMTPGSSTTNSQNVFLGTGSEVSNVADSMSAVIVVRGPISQTDLDNLESWLAMMFAVGPV